MNSPIEQPVSSQLSTWLMDTGSLTERLKQRFPGEFRVEVLWHDWHRPTWEEALLVGLSHPESTLVREVILRCNNLPMVFARSIIPQASVKPDGCSLLELGDKALGALLFASKAMTRGPIETLAFDREKIISQHQCDELIPSNSPALLGRRSVFFLDSKPLLVAEYFLPQFLDAINQDG